MDKQKHQKTLVSVIIPACNEELYLKRTIDSVRAQSYKHIEIIVVVNGSTDKTFTIAENHADIAIDFAEGFGPARARNEGVLKAKGSLYVFVDADTQLSHSVVSNIVRAHEQNKKRGIEVFGACKALPSRRTVRSLAFFGFKNFIHKVGFYKGVLALIFCDAELFKAANGFNPKKRVGEFKGFIERCVTNGGRYVFVDNCFVVTSVRRFEKEGYFTTLWFWIKWAALSLFKKRTRIAHEYKPIR
jgi:glycosyltransferase involved in cell wall biosynthesis